MTFYTRDLYESRGVAERISRLPIARIAIGDRLYPVDAETVARLTEAYRRGDALPPIRVRRVPDFSRSMAEWTFPLIYGHCRLLAAKAAGHTEIAVEIVGCTDVEARRLESRENLDRRTLNADQQMHGIAALVQLRLDEEQSVPPGPKVLAGHRGESGLSKAARGEGISETTAKRAMRIAAIAPAAKLLYRAALPNITRSDLEVIARAPSAHQVEVTQRVLDARKAGRPSAVVAATAEPTRAEPVAEHAAAEEMGARADGDTADADDNSGVGLAEGRGPRRGANAPANKVGVDATGSRSTVKTVGTTSKIGRAAWPTRADAAAALIVQRLDLSDRALLVRALEGVKDPEMASRFVRSLLGQLRLSASPGGGDARGALAATIVGRPAGGAGLAPNQHTANETRRQGRS